jgi:hypothetical protein
MRIVNALLSFQDSFAELNRLELAQTTLHAFLQPQHSYLSVVELGLYESSAKTYAALAKKGFAQGSAEWNAGVQEVVVKRTSFRQKRKARRSRLSERLASAGYQPMPNAICSGCGVVIVVLWLLLSSYEKPYARPPIECLCQNCE